MAGIANIRESPNICFSYKLGRKYRLFIQFVKKWVRKHGLGPWRVWLKLAFMAIGHELHVALKEWATVCTALETGRQILLLRKGGIHETGGQFELEHSRFL